MGFFDFMTHLIIHLIDELEICGLVATRWCYLVERYLFVLKKHMKNKAKLEGCIASSYIDEALGFCIEYFCIISVHNLLHLGCK